MQNIIMIIIITHVFVVVSFQPDQQQQTSSEWVLMTTLDEGENIGSTMSRDGEIYAIYEGFSPKVIRIVSVKGDIINEIDTQFQIEDRIAYPTSIISLSYTGKYLAAEYYEYYGYTITILRVWDTSSGETVLEIPNIYSALFGVNNNLLLFSTHNYENIDQVNYSIIYDLDEKAEKARFFGEHLGRFTDINAEGTAALLVGNDAVFYYVDLEDPFTKLPISIIDERYGFEYFRSSSGHFYTSELIFFKTTSIQGSYVSVHQLVDREIIHIRDIYHYALIDVVADENVFGLQNYWENEYGIELFDPISGEMFFSEKRMWQYLAISPDSKWIASLDWESVTISILSYPSMELVTQVENCSCDQLQFSADSTRFMTVSEDEVSKIMIFELVE